MPSYRRSRRGGFSFVEVLVAVTILGAASAALFLTFHAGALEGKISEDRLKALALAQKEVERIKQVAAMGRGSLEHFWDSPAKRVKRYVVDDCYTVLVTVDPKKAVTLGGSTAEVGEALVTVSWQRPARGEEHVQLSTIIDQAYY